MTELRFTDLALSDDMLSALDEMGYVTPTPVQASAVPLVATGQDLMVQSQTGTGKTAAFGIPLIENLVEKRQGVQALILCPTRELAKQVSEELQRLGKYKRVQTAAVYGGASMEKQVAEMRFAQVISGTPGRVLDHLKRKNLRLDGLSVMILDEADEMLSMGFARELASIMGFVPNERQTLLFSATIPQDVKRYAKRYMREPEFLSMVEENVGADDVEHHYYMVSGVGRSRDLVQVIEYEEPESAIVFCNTRKDSELVAKYLKRQGYNAEYLNGDLPQRERERIMGRAKDKTLRFLCATDVAARGIDISQLSHVINYLLPESPEVYIHRTGRTGRAGSKGKAISLIGPREIGVYYYLKRIYNVALQERSVPTQAEIELQREERRTQALIKEIIDAVGPVDTTEAELRAQTMRLLESDDAVEVVGTLLHAFRNRGFSAGEAKQSDGGVLKEVPKPDRIDPGSRAQTVKSVADRVAIIQSAHTASKEAAAKPAQRRRRRRRRRDEEAVLAAAPAAEPEAVEEPKPVEAAPAPEPEPIVEAAPEPEPEPIVEAAPEAEPEPVVEPEPTPEPEPEPAVEAAPEPAPAPEPEDEAIDDEGAVRLFVNVGKRDGFSQADALREELAELGGLLPEDFVDIAVRSRHSYVLVHEDFAEDLIEGASGETVGGRTLRIEVARDD